MPTYDYLCTTCTYKFEHFQSMSDEPIRICPNCSGSVRRIIGGGTGLIFKGSGYYLTDYKAKPANKDKLQKKMEPKKQTSNKGKNEKI